MTFLTSFLTRTFTQPRSLDSRYWPLSRPTEITHRRPLRSLRPVNAVLRVFEWLRRHPGFVDSASDDALTGMHHVTRSPR